MVDRHPNPTKIICNFCYCIEQFSPQWALKLHQLNRVAENYDRLTAYKNPNMPTTSYKNTKPYLVVIELSVDEIATKKRTDSKNYSSGLLEP